MDKAVQGLIVAEIPRLRRYARFMLGSADLADDLVQECLMHAVAKIDSWELGSSMRAWLFTILRNAIFSHWRRVKHRPETIELLPNNNRLAVPGDHDSNLQISELQSAFDQLSYEYRELLLMVVVEGLKYTDAAALLKVPVGTVRSRLSRARTALAQILKDRSRDGTGGEFAQPIRMTGPQAHHSSSRLH